METFDDRYPTGRSDMGTVGSSSRLVRAMFVSGTGYRRDIVLGSNCDCPGVSVNILE